MSQKWDMAGNDLVVNGVYVGASTPGSAGTLLSGSEITVLDSVTPGTVAASKAVVVDSNKDIATFRHFTLSGNFVTGSTTLSEADLAQVDGITAGTVSASKALVPTSGKELTWTTTSSGTGTVTPLSLTMTNTGIGASMDGAYFITATEAALGTYANAVNGKLNFGTAGRVSDLGAPI